MYLSEIWDYMCVCIYVKIDIGTYMCVYVYIFEYICVDIHEVLKITILQRKVENNWPAVTKNCSRLFIRISEDLDDLDAASQVCRSTQRTHFLRGGKNPNLSWGETVEHYMTCIFVEIKIWKWKV